LFLETLEKRERNEFAPLKIIKLDATLSTNDFAKGLLSKGALREDTLIWAMDQYGGRGQQGSNWYSMEGESLTISLVRYFDSLDAKYSTSLSLAVSLGILRALQAYDLPKLRIKWPNDIMSANHKLAGILIENQLRSSRIDSSVIGIGINVNNRKFPDLPKATSMKLQTGTTYKLESLMREVGHSVFQMLRQPLDFDVLHNAYKSVLFKQGEVCRFVKADGEVFDGVISGLSRAGKLLVRTGPEKIEAFGLKEITLDY